MADQSRFLNHLLWRAGFGPSLSENSRVSASGSVRDAIAAYRDIETASSRSPEKLAVSTNLASIVYNGNGQEPMRPGQPPLNRALLTKEQRKQLQVQSREDLKRLNLAWLDQMTNSPQQLLEKMSLFWHNHFACRNINIYFQQGLVNSVREQALGNFGDLLKSVSKSASMLGFLNNQQNRKAHPNENFAREVMELFTLGRGNYTEQDIKEAARAFTGWAFNLQGEFIFRPFQHDTGSKTIFGKTGNFNGDDVLNMLLERRETAYHISEKIYRNFVNDDVNPDHVREIADKFYQGNYDIAGLMRNVFTSSWFYDEANIGTHIKSPVELMVGIRRQLPMHLENPQVQLLLQRALGQLLFYPPNVAGWPGGKNWIDSSSLMLRLRIPQLIKDDDTVFITPKQDDDQQMGIKENNADQGAHPAKEGMAPQQYNVRGTGKRADQRPGAFNIRANVNWEQYAAAYKDVPREQLWSSLRSALLTQGVTPFSEVTLKSIIDSSSRENYIKTATVALMATPEYQLS